MADRAIGAAKEGINMWERASENRPIMHYGARQFVPFSLTLDRAWRWCIQATIRDMRCASGRHREISAPNLRRMFTRRWADTCRLYDIAEDSEERAGLLEAGMVVLAQGCFTELLRIRKAHAAAHALTAQAA